MSLKTSKGSKRINKIMTLSTIFSHPNDCLNSVEANHQMGQLRNVENHWSRVQILLFQPMLTSNNITNKLNYQRTRTDIIRSKTQNLSRDYLIIQAKYRIKPKTKMDMRLPHAFASIRKCGFFLVSWSLMEYVTTESSRALRIIYRKGIRCFCKSLENSIRWVWRMEMLRRENYK